jgi:predicted enzyme related to lactoylglutathione lyase
MNVQGITWHAITLEDNKFDAFAALAGNVMGLKPIMEFEGIKVFATADGTLLELYKKSTVTHFGYNGSVAFGFRVDDIEVASEELKKAGCELLGDINRVPEMKYAYRHFKGPDGLIYGLNEQK